VAPAQVGGIVVLRSQCPGSRSAIWCAVAKPYGVYASNAGRSLQTNPNISLRWPWTTRYSARNATSGSTAAARRAGHIAAAAATARIVNTQSASVRGSKADTP
jgi:hypothetical protein